MTVTRLSADDGSSSLEFITAGLILLVPLVYLVLALSALQGGTLAAEGAARQAARVYVQAGTEEAAQQRAEVAVAIALGDYGIDAEDARIAISCAGGDTCLTRSGFVTITVRVDVGMPLVPSVLDLSEAARVPVQAQSTQQVSRFWREG
ncbi:hypothetical protein GCM10027416_13040 [Okibacterium endophyticum]